MSEHRTEDQVACGHTHLFADDFPRGPQRVLPCLYCKIDRLTTQRDETNAALMRSGRLVGEKNADVMMALDQRDRLRAALIEVRESLEITHRALCLMAEKHGEPVPPPLPERTRDETDYMGDFLEHVEKHGLLSERQLQEETERCRSGRYHQGSLLTQCILTEGHNGPHQWEHPEKANG